MTGQEDVSIASKPFRRFAPQPVETTTSSHRASKKKVADPAGHDDSSAASKPVRRFAAQPIETTASSNRSSQKKVSVDSSPENGPPKRRFLPQPEETTVRSNRRSKLEATRDSDSDKDGLEEGSGSTSKQGPNGQRQFLPQLVETGKRSRKVGDGTSILKQFDKTDSSPGDRTYQPRHVRLQRPPVRVPENTPVNSTFQVPQLPESRFSYASLSSKQPERRKSFQVPTLASITSTGDSDDDSEGSNVPSLSTTPSASSEEVDIRNKVRRIHTESHDDKDKKFSGYILSLAATAAQRQLQEQALAAFPNERQHQHVNHFAIDDEDSISDKDDEIHHGLPEDPDFYQRRMSSAGWDLIEMQKHKEMLEEQRRQQRLREEQASRKASEFDPWSNPYDLTTLRITRVDLEAEPKSTLGGALRDVAEVTKMRHAASPPMLGGDIKFPQSLSPQHTMMDPTQRPVCRKQGRFDGYRSRQNSGLWTPHSHSPVVTRKNTATSRHQGEVLPSPGLWGGFCQVAAESTTHSTHLISQKSKLQSGLMTPANEQADPFSPTSTPILTPYHRLPITPNLIPEADVNLAGIDSILELEATIDEEYPDSFITQVYNYLSLGYPALARDYDLELSKISRVPVEDIRRGDDRVNSKGHIGAPESEGWDERKCMDECGRWAALRLYVREWARQQPKFAEEQDLRKAARARRGSWGV